MGLSEPGETDSEAGLTLKELNFSQTFSQIAMMLGQAVNVNLQLTKVINQTLPLVNDDLEEFDGLWIGLFTINYYDSFVGETDYMLSTITVSTSTILIMTITETAYYILNVEQPIANLAEVIFHNLLFTIVALEIFGLLSLIFKLILIPLFSFIFVTKCKRQRNSIPVSESEGQHNHELPHSPITSVPKKTCT